MCGFSSSDHRGSVCVAVLGKSHDSELSLPTISSTFCGAEQLFRAWISGVLLRTLLRRRWVDLALRGLVPKSSADLLFLV